MVMYRKIAKESKPVHVRILKKKKLKKAANIAVFGLISGGQTVMVRDQKNRPFPSCLLPLFHSV